MKQQGFTLIELIIVIVILGILAVTAAPKFIDIQSDARESTLQGVVGAMKSSIQTVHAKSLIAGNENNATDTITSGSDTINIVYGYPAATGAGIVASMDVDAGSSGAAGGEWAFFEASGTPNTLLFAPAASVTFSGTPAASDITGTNCYITYTEAEDENTPATVALTSATGC